MLPVQRTLTTPGLTIDPLGFQGSLTTRQETALGTPLGHVVDPEAPSGLGHGIAEASASPPGSGSSGEDSGASSIAWSSADASSPQVQRSIAFASPPVSSLVPLQRATASSMVRSGDTDAGPSLRVPHIPAPEGGFEPGPHDRSDDRPASNAASAEAPGDAAVSVQAVRPVQEPARDPAPSPAPETRPKVAPQAPADPRPPAMPLQRARQAGDTGRASTDDVSMSFRPGPHAGRMPLGFGEPLAELPPTAQRSAVARSGPEAPSPVPASTPADAGIPAAPEAPADAPSFAGEAGGGVSPEGGAHEDSPATLPVAPLLGDAPTPLSAAAAEGPAEQDSSPVQRAVDMPLRPGAVSPDTRSTPGAAHAEAMPAPLLPPVSPLPVVPLVAQRAVPLYSGVELPNSGTPASAQTATGPATRGSASPDGPTVVPVRWEPSAGPQVQRTSPADSRAAAARPSASSPAAGMSTSVTGATVQRAVGPGPVPVRNAGDVAVASGLGRRAADGSVVFDHLMVQRAEEGETGVDPEPPSEPVVSDPADANPPDTQPPSAEDSGEPAQPGEPPGGPEAGAGDDASPSRQPGQGGPPVVTDELVRALYAPLSRMLRADLRLERERAGFLIDTGH
jgi:hypothetical protein